MAMITQSRIYIAKEVSNMSFKQLARTTNCNYAYQLARSNVLCKKRACLMFCQHYLITQVGNFFLLRRNTLGATELNLKFEYQ